MTRQMFNLVSRLRRETRLNIRRVIIREYYNLSKHEENEKNVV